MIRRGPALPGRRIFAWTCGMILFAIAIASTLVATQNLPYGPTPLLFLPAGASLAGMAVMSGSFELLKRLEKHGWNASAPRLRNWLAYFGTMGLAGLATGGIRGQMILTILGPEAFLWIIGSEWVLGVYGALLVAIILDLQTHFGRKALRRREESRQAVRALFESREAWIQARERRRGELHRILAQRVEPELAAIHAQLSPDQPPPTSDQLGEICDRLDYLRDEEVRRLSHLEHPSIIDIGLAPALRGLARRFRSRLEVRLDAEATLLDSFSPAMRLMVYRMVELMLENASEQHGPETGGREPISVRIAHREDQIELVVSGRQGIFDFERARSDGYLALLDGRVAQLEGSWELLDGPPAGIRVRVGAGEAATRRSSEGT